MFKMLFSNRIPTSGIYALLAVAMFYIASHKTGDWMAWALIVVCFSLLVCLSLVVKIFRENKVEKVEGVVTIGLLCLFSFYLIIALGFPLVASFGGAPLDEKTLIKPANYWVWALCIVFFVAALIGCSGGFDPKIVDLQKGSDKV